ncbi:ribosome biogenesis kri1 [Lecanosticta acicola]|uniref:Ribosome biogenesis kri1 n=1 Tax=Lecanosticta acicola TaxID=111012 RepID=A0AAI8YUW5_9PEZI|nr:ribosome biogenesis kri1 [Lecanosticta acicola]
MGRIESLDAVRHAKRTKLLDEGSDDEVKTGSGNGFKINEEFAKRFEYNKKREEKQQLEEKYGASSSGKRKRGDDEGSEEESSTDEDEDDDAELATADVDEEIMATLNAIKSKDPRVYDTNVKFYREFDPETAGKDTEKKEKPMYLSDYHRQNLLAGNAGVEEEDEEEPRVQTFQEEQDEMRRELVGSMHALANSEDDDAEEDDMLVAKKKQTHDNLPVKSKPKKTKKITEKDIEEANKDPETFLSNFMAARAWLPGEGSRFQPLESDDSEDEKKADEFEEAYNLRFEDPAANEKLKSFSRDVGKYGVRREDKSGRQKAREREREQKEAEKREREEDRARLRKLKVEEAEQKVKRIKEAAGLRGKELNLDEWRDVIEGDFDDEKWEQEMKRRFGEGYYAEDDAGFGSDDEENEKSKSRKPKKPEWDDDIDIKDLVPEFEDKPDITLSSDEEDGGAPLPAGSLEDEAAVRPKKKTKKDREKEKTEAKRAARKERLKIEEMVDASLPLHDPNITAASSSKAPVVGFRYRETSPSSFGLSARDILFADDARLNEYAGLKKMAAFRDPEKKRRDKKKFSKKARLRQWRKETFGQIDEPTGGFERILGGAPAGHGAAMSKDEGNAKDGARKKKRSKKRKGEDGKAVES